MSLARFPRPTLALIHKRWSGHSRWSKIKHAKGATDAAKGQVYTRILKDITASVLRDGPDPSKNIRLETIVTHAKKENIPKATIDSAIKRGSGIGTAAGKPLTCLLYGGIGPAGVALVIEALTDNRTRAVSVLKSLMKKYRGSISSSALFNFEHKGRIVLNQDSHSFDKVFEHAIDHGAENVEQDQDSIHIIVEPPHTTSTAKCLQEKYGYSLNSVELAWIPKSDSRVCLDPDSDDGHTFAELIRCLQEEPDIVKVYHNAI
ncbi:putative transcriptional regulatory protein [Neolecta irregularis DAH-3]|uniref:Putative transcriptional regulatory protein n=1 Tax=Neolecta irregularis (strain DAH-3) TaxID=1198029 RepID=A0A1U7LI67_NEOID|nr:putative transcriptional regulatory protein [Neolecta irregularis DAH-3]|eukprot:OLL22242.1 putative transcriptional regulatory protein [Neolecta irregularis DAH-3]